MRMEARAVEILKDKTGLEFESLVRVSDGCVARVAGGRGGVL